MNYRQSPMAIGWATYARCECPQLVTERPDEFGKEQSDDADDGKSDRGP